MKRNPAKNLSTGKIAVVVSAVFLIALPLIIFRPVKERVRTVEPQKRFTFMTNAPRAVSDKHDLVYWEKVGNPELFAKPDSKFGFSAYSRPEFNHERPGAMQEKSLPELEKLLPGKVILPGKPRNPAEFLSAVEIPLVQVDEQTISLYRKSPVFIMDDGSVLAISGIFPQRSDVKDLVSTLLQVTRSQKDAPPEIRILRSSGDQKLDQAAFRALHFPAAVNEKISGIIRVEWEQTEEIQ